MSLFHTHLLLPLAERERHAGLARRLREIRRFEALPEAAQREQQQLRLQRILQHAYDTVPYYRKRFDDAGVHPSRVRVGEPIPIPVTTRDMLRKECDTLVSTAYKPEELKIAASSGTTSTPITFRRDLGGLRDKVALNLQLNAWSGFDAGDSVLMLWGAQRDLAIRPSWRWRLYEEVLMRCTSAPCGIVNEEVLERFRQRYEKQRPKVIYGYSTVVAEFASYLRKCGIRHRPKIVIATAETLNDQNRQLIESVFNTKLFIYYGSRDVGMIAAECSAHGGLHFHPWASYVEFDPIGDTPDGPAYRLLVTDLLNYGQPFIRYDTGDCVTLANPVQTCSCGRWFPRVRKILGRVADGLLLPDGGLVPGVTVGCQMTSLCQNFRAISRIQLVQKSLGHFHLRYAVKTSDGAEFPELESILDGIDSLVHDRIRWTLEKVAEIPPEVSGKTRLCISEIQNSNSVFLPAFSNQAASSPPVMGRNMS